MDFTTFSASNLIRCESPTGFNHPLNSWAEEQWTNALAGEAGEACNLAKKILRLRQGIAGNKEGDKDISDLRKRLAAEIADVVIYADLAIQALGLSTEEVVREKFNQKSDEIGSSIKV